MIDASTMSVEDLCAFYEREISDAKENDILLSLVRDEMSSYFFTNKVLDMDGYLTNNSSRIL